MKGAVNKVERLISQKTSRALLPELEQSIVSFGFDDCPASAIETGLPMLEAEGWNATIYVACGLCETENHLGRHMSLSDIVDVHSRGHEIADHTYSHLSIHEVGTPDYLADIEKNQKALKALGVAESRHFAYPYGHVSPELKRALGEQFKTMRGVVPFLVRVGSIQVMT
jgi:peptidoglycan/xylan/chitin deacetylase (PgdA/CDA1 family)